MDTVERCPELWAVTSDLADSDELLDDDRQSTDYYCYIRLDSSRRRRNCSCRIDGDGAGAVEQLSEDGGSKADELDDSWSCPTDPAALA